MGPFSPTGSKLPRLANRLKIRLKTPEAVAGAFEALEGCRADGVLENYAVTQASLEDVFVSLARKHARRAEEVEA